MCLMCCHFATSLSTKKTAGDRSYAKSNQTEQPTFTKHEVLQMWDSLASVWQRNGLKISGPTAYLVLIHTSTQYHMKRYVSLLLQELLEFQFAAIFSFFFDEFDCFHILEVPKRSVICNVTTSKQLFMSFFQNSLPVLHLSSRKTYPSATQK